MNLITIIHRRFNTSIILLTAILASFSSFATGLSGTYTIDASKTASASIYTSFNDADSDLVYGTRANGATANGPGITSAVTFKVADGIYNEQVYIPAITGASPSSQITFKSASGDSSKVILTTAISGTYYSRGYVVRLYGATNINFYQITMQRTYSSYYDDVMILDGASDSNTVMNCQLIGSYTSGSYSYGALIYSGYNNYTYSIDQNNTYRNNYMKDAYYGFYLMGYYTSGGAEQENIIDHNTIDSIGYYGIFTQIQDSLTITNNKINMPYGNYGIYGYYINYSYYGALGTSLIANNFISVAKSSASYSYNAGIYLGYLDNTYIADNNINIYGSGYYGSYGAYLYYYSTTSALYVYGNNFVNKNTGANDYALYAYNITDENNDNLKTGGSTLGFLNGSSYTTLSAWKAGTGFGSKDTSVDPLYVSNTDLHVNSVALNNTGKSLSLITTDIDGDKRNLTTPDIGADEFTPPPINPVVHITGPTSGFCAGSQNITVNLTNAGTSTLTSATIEWSINGTSMTAYSWTGSLASGSSTSVTLGSYSFSSATTVYKLVSYPSQGNGSTISKSSLNSDSSNIRSGMSGTFSIDNSGSGSPNYTSFRGAVNDLNLKGLCGAVTFNVADGYYNESVILNTLSGASSTNTVTFQSKSHDSTKVILDSSWTGYRNWTLKLNGASWVTFRQMTISNASSNYYADAVELVGGAHNNTFERDVLMGSTSSYTYGAVIYDDYASNDYGNIIRNNQINGGYYGLMLQGPGNTNGEMGNQVYNNLIDSAYGYGMYAQFQDSLYFSKNIIIMSTGYVGLYSYYNVTKGGHDTSLISNNFITMQGTYSYGIEDYYSSAINYYNNSVNVSTTYTYYYAVYFYNYGTAHNVNFVDNIVVNDGGGNVVNCYNGITYSDYNDWYTSGSSYGYWNSASCASLADIQSANGMDAHSVSGDPLYASPSTGDLHLSKSSGVVINKGFKEPQVNDDIDGQKRNIARPNIGADETRPFGNDASALSIDSPLTPFCAGTKDIYVRIANAGTNSISKVSVNWSVNGSTKTSYAWTGTLAAGASTLVKVGSVSFSVGVTKQIIAWTSNPNGAADSVPGNDSTSATPLGAGLSGTLTIGGSSPTFSTFKDAVYSLNTSGVCGAVTFNVRDGYYNESIEIKRINGASSVNTVTFQSQSLDSTKVILDTAWTGYRNWTLKLTGANWITFRLMTISNIGTAYYSDAVEITGGSNHNTFERNVLMANTSGGYIYNAVVYDDYSSSDNYNTIKDNQVNGGFYGLYLEGPGGGTSGQIGNVVKNNLIDSTYYYGIFTQYLDSMYIAKNIITLANGNYGYGMYIYNNMGNGSGTDSSYIVNNFVSALGSYYNYGIMSYYSNMLNIYNNSFYTTGTYTYTFTGYIYNYTTSTTNLVNNIFQSTASSPAIYITSGGAVNRSDYNDFYTNGSVMGNWNGTSCADITAWRAASKKDAHSVSGDPVFTSPATGDLHLTAASKVALHGGVALPSVKDDIDGQRRSPLPNIGADETRTYGNDIGISAVDSPTAGFCASTKDVYVKLQNYGNNTVTSATINWSVGGTSKTAVSWTGTLPAYSFTLVKLGSISFAAGVTNQIIAGTSSPNGATDSNTANDIDTANVGAGLSGTLTIGGSSPNYATFRDAVASLNSFGVCGPVIFNVRDGYYNESVQINAIKGSSKINTVTFQSQSLDSTKVTLDTAWCGTYTYPPSGYSTLTINGASYLTFRLMSISNTCSSSYSYYSSAVEIHGGSKHINILNNIISGPNGSSSYYGAAISSYKDVDSNITIRHNSLKYGYYTVYFSQSSGSYEPGLVIASNNIDSGYYAGMYLYYLEAPLIHRNVITNIQYTYNPYGIYAYYLDGATKIDKNRIVMNGGYAIYLYSVTGNKSTAYIDNNFISVSPSTYTYYSSIGIYLSSCSRINTYYNSIYMTGGNSSYGIYVYNYSGGNNTNIVDNNISDSSGSCLYYYQTGGVTKSNYNNLYTNNYVGYTSSGGYTTLANWNSATSFDKNSISIAPKFKSFTDLHTNNTSLIKGTPNSISDDIDSIKRHSIVTTIGATELRVFSYDASISQIDSPAQGKCTGAQSVYVTLLNAGDSAMTSCTISWSVNGSAKTAYSWTGSLTRNQTASVKLGSVTLVSGSITTIAAWSNKPDGQVDSNTANDTSTISVGAGLSGTYTIDNSGSGTPNYTSFRAAVSDLNLRGLCGAVVYKVADGTYNESIVINPITGSSPTSTVTFQSKSLDSSKVVLDTAWSNYSPRGYTVQLNGANYVNFRKMTIANPGSTSYYYNDVIELMGGASHNTFENNILVGNTTTTNYYNSAVVFDDYNSSKEQYNTIRYNHISGNYNSVYLGSNSSTSGEIGNMVIANTIDSAFYYAVYITYQDSMQIARNNIFMPTSYYGIYYTSYNYTPKDSNYIANNFITLQNLYGGYALMVYYPDMLNVYFNSINTSSSYTYYYPVYFYNYTTVKSVRFLNNIINNDNGGALVYVYGSSITYSDYNDWYSSGSSWGSWNGTSCTSLSDIQSANSMDANSVSGDPMYNSPSTGDLHLTYASTIVQHAGLALSSIKDDIDGEVRSSKPNIGADETRLYDYDASAASIDSPVVGICSGTKDVYVRLLNAGRKTLTSVTIDWKVNGTSMSTVSWTGTLSSFSFTLVKLGSVTLSSGSAKNLKVWTSKPDGVVDSNPKNDTATKKVGSGLSGTYTIDNSGTGTPSYTSFHAAVSDLNVRGVCGAVTFNVADGYYNESAQILPVVGSSSINTVTFQSKSLDSSKVTLDTSYGGSFSIPGYTVNLKGAKYVNFRKMTITNYPSSSYSYANCVYLSSGASNNTIENNIIATSTTSYSNYGSCVFFDNNNAESYNLIRYNQINGGEAGVYMVRGSSSGLGRGNIINRNNIDSAWQYAIAIQYQDSYYVTANNIVVPTGYYGIYMYNYNASPTDSSFIANNFITVQGTYCYGIMGSYTDMVNLYFNSINSSSTYSYYYPVYFYNYSTVTSVNFVNNIVVSDNSNTVVYVAGSAITNSDFNDWYTAGSIYGYWNGTSCTSLADIQSANGMDANSVSGDPMYSSPSTGDLHLTSASSVVMHKGTPLFSITNDIDGQARTAKPNMGADETRIYQFDASAASIDSPAIGFCSGTKDVYVKLLNAGSQTLTTVYIDWKLNGKSMSTVTWSGSLASFASTPVKLGSVTFTSGSSQTIKAWTSKPDGMLDSNTVNDTTSKSKGGGLSGTYSIDNSGSGTPNYTSFRSAVADLMARGLCGPVTFNAADGYYNESITIGAVSGSSAINTVTFQSKSLDSSKVDLDSSYGGTYTAHGYVVGLNGSKFINFRKITISNYPASTGVYADAVNLFNGASNNIFEDNIIETSTSGYSTYGSAIYFNYNSAESYNTIRYNQINGGEAGVYMVSNSSTAVGIGNMIYRNNIDSAWEYAIAIQFQDSFFVGANNIFMPNGYYGIYTYQYNYAPVDSSYIVNNFITMQNSYCSGIQVYYADMLNVYYNSINTSNSSTYYYGAYFYSNSTPTAVNFVDNIIVNDNSAPVVYVYNSAISNSDFNDWYTSGSTYGYWNGTTCSSLSDIQSANSMDANSVSGDPLYSNTSIGDLHLTTSSTVVLKKGVPIGITTDIDGQKRPSTKPDIGADEYNSDSTDVGVTAILNPVNHGCGNTNTLITLKVHNFGTKAQSSSSFTVTVVVSGGKSATGTASLSSTLSSGADAIVVASFSTALNTSAGGVFKFKAYTNLSGDQDHTNDTFTVIDTLVVPPVASFSTSGSGAVCSGKTLTATSGVTGTYNYRYYLRNSSGAVVDSVITSGSAANFTISRAGTYRLTQVVYTVGGCYDTTSKVVTVNANPVPAFTYTGACLNDTAKFTDMSSAGSGTISSYKWHFGNGDSATTATPATIYKAIGANTVRLTVTNSNGCSADTQQLINIDTINAHFTPSVPLVDGTVNFTAASSGLKGYAWNFGDGSSGSGGTTSYQYTKTGHYWATLTATNTAGCSATQGDSIIILTTGVADFAAGKFGMQVYPNPFREYTNINYSLDKEGAVKIVVYDMMGRSIATLLDHHQAAGNYNLRFDASENNVLVSGSYIIRMTVGDRVILKPITLVK